jgi:hypothetical protein
MIRHVLVYEIANDHVSWARFGILNMLTSIGSGDQVDRSYLVGLAMLGTGFCVVAGACIEAICVALAETRDHHPSTH